MKAGRTARGRPRDEEDAPEHEVVRRGYGLLRRLHNRVARNDHTYLELAPLTEDKPAPEEEGRAATVRASHQVRREQSPSRA
jgi:hypothetical protein